MMKLIAAICAPVLLSACSAFPEFNPPEESMAKAPRASRPAERMAALEKRSPSVVYESGIWIARRKPEQASVTVTQPRAAHTWEVNSADKTLKQAIARWASSAGWQLVWDLRADYEVQARTSLAGTFEEAMEAMATHMENAEVPLKVIFYKQNKVVRIVAKGAE